ncbi:hypothetical protein M8J76_010449 [Diaphorina citri]|nr:hypothetical protein M8J76_010449 [Diaphorina citri]
MVSTRLQSGCSSGLSASSSTASCPPPADGNATTTAASTSVIVSPAGSGPSLAPTYSNQIQTLALATTPGPSKAAINLMQFPTELLEKILLYLDFKHIAALRLVNRRMNTVCGSILSTTFNRLQSTMLARFQSIKSKMPRRESARRQHPLACESDIVEMLHMRLALLQMSFGKHIERQHCCFFAGEILDEIYRIIHYIKTTPRLARPYKVTDELFDLSTMAMEYFKEKIEPTLPEITYFGTDFMDIAGPFPSSKNDSIACGSDAGGCGFESTLELSPRSPPQSNMVLRKRIHKIKQGMKRYSSQLTLMKRDLKLCKVKLVDQTKTVVEYATRLDEYDKKNEETSRKFSQVLQELNKCKTELQFFRSKFPFNPDCTCSGPAVATDAPLIAPDLSQVLSPQAMHLSVGGGSLAEFLQAPPTLESADLGLQVAAIPLAGSASPRATDDDAGEPTASTGKKSGRSRQQATGSTEDELSGTASETTTAAPKKPGRPRHQAAAEHAAKPSGSTSPRGSEEETSGLSGETAALVVMKKPGRPRGSNAAHGEPIASTSAGDMQEHLASRKPARRSANTSTNVSGKDEDSSGGSDQELNTPASCTRKYMRASVGGAGGTSSDYCLLCSSGGGEGGHEAACSMRTKKRKATALSGAGGVVLSPGTAETKVLRGASSMAATASSSGLSSCKRSRR